jgi:exonuclease I
LVDLIHVCETIRPEYHQPKASHLTLIFYDTETTGTHTAFDQIVQFAAIRTDDDLNELGRFDLRSRLLPWVIPSPGALRATGMTIDMITHESRRSHYDMVTKIRRTLGTACPATFISDNAMRFDEELLRQAFYQCLHPPLPDEHPGQHAGRDHPHHFSATGCQTAFNRDPRSACKRDPFGGGFRAHGVGRA